MNVRHDRFDVYIGRDSTLNGVPIEDLGFGNPFHVPGDGTLAQVVAAHRAWLRADESLMERVRNELGGKRLGCWCVDKLGEGLCHGFALKELADTGYLASRA